MGGGPKPGAARSATSGLPVQDMPPPGGYPKIDYGFARTGLPKRGPPGWMIWGGFIAFTTYGFIQLAIGNRRNNRSKIEKREGRMALVPLLQAEEDVRFLRARLDSLEKEAAVMKGVKGWKVGESPYKTTWLPPTSYA